MKGVHIIDRSTGKTSSITATRIIQADTEGTLDKLLGKIGDYFADIKKILLSSGLIGLSPEKNKTIATSVLMGASAMTLQIIVSYAALGVTCFVVETVMTEEIIKVNINNGKVFEIRLSDLKTFLTKGESNG